MRDMSAGDGWFLRAALDSVLDLALVHKQQVLNVRGVTCKPLQRRAGAPQASGPSRSSVWVIYL